MPLDLRAIKERLAEAKSPACITPPARLLTFSHLVAVDVPALVSEVESLRAEVERRPYHVLVCTEHGTQKHAACSGCLIEAESDRRYIGDLLRRLARAAKAVSDDHGPVEDEGCDHCALMWRELNDALASAIREEP